MPVFRVEKNSNYTTMCNYHLRDQGLSLKGKGLLSMLLSLPDTWNYSVRGLSSITPDGVDGVLTALKELERLGYLERNQQRESNGRMGRAEYVIYEMPRKKPCSESPCTEKPYTVNPDTDTPVTENPAQLSTNRTSTETINKREKKEIQHRYAERMVTQAWNNQDYVLDSGDFTGVDFKTVGEHELAETRTMDVLLVQPNAYPKKISVGTELEDLQAMVGGDIEVTYPFEDEVAIILNESGKINGLPLNRAIYTEDGDMAVFILLKLDFRSILQGLHIVQGRRITIRLSERREQPGAKFDIVEYWQVIRNNEYIS